MEGILIGDNVGKKQQRYVRMSMYVYVEEDVGA